jgi:hypothetical protein
LNDAISIQFIGGSHDALSKFQISSVESSHSIAAFFGFRENLNGFSSHFLILIVFIKLYHPGTSQKQENRSELYRKVR